MPFVSRYDCNNNLYFKRAGPVTIKSILPSGSLKTKLIITNYNSHDKKPITNSNYNKRS